MYNVYYKQQFEVTSFCKTSRKHMPCILPQHKNSFIICTFTLNLSDRSTGRKKVNNIGSLSWSSTPQLMRASQSVSPSLTICNSNMSYIFYKQWFLNVFGECHDPLKDQMKTTDTHPWKTRYYAKIRSSLKI